MEQYSLGSGSLRLAGTLFLSWRNRVTRELYKDVKVGTYLDAVVFLYFLPLVFHLRINPETEKSPQWTRVSSS
jgi:hypothetical protein